jgi:hypothetical protein
MSVSNYLLLVMRTILYATKLGYGDQKWNRRFGTSPITETTDFGYLMSRDNCLLYNCCMPYVM